VFSGDEPDEVASVKRVPEFTLRLWESLLRPQGYYISAGKLVRNPAAVATGSPPQPSSPARVPPSHAGKSHQPFRRAATLPALPSAPHDEEVAGSSGAEAVSSCPSLFAGLTFRVLGEARCANVRSAIEGSGGRTVPENGPDDEVDHIIVRLVRWVT
jgi:DNA replication regulator DPB11